MSSCRRDVLEILLDIIEGVKVSINKTKLMNKTNLNWKPFKKYADFLESKGFIMKIPPPPLTRKKGRDRVVKFHYIITVKGNELLDQISEGLLLELLSYRDLDIMEEIS